MTGLITWWLGAIGAVAHALTMPLLRGIGGVLATLAIPTLRGLAGVSLIVAAVALASDMGTATMGASRQIQPTAVVKHWQQLAPGTFDATRTFMTKRGQPWMWDAFSTPLRMPTFVFFSLTGLLFGYLGRRRHRVNIFAN